MEGKCLMLLLILWLQFSLADFKALASMCTMMDPFQLPHKYHQMGDLIIGAIASQFGCIFDEMSFSEHPKTKLIDEL